MKAFILLSTMFICLLTLMTNGQSVLQYQTIEDKEMRQEVLKNHAADMRRD